IERRPRTRTHQDLPVPPLPAPAGPTEGALPAPGDLPPVEPGAGRPLPAPEAVRAAPNGAAADQPPPTLPPHALPRPAPAAEEAPFAPAKLGPAAYEAAPPPRAPAPSVPEGE